MRISRLFIAFTMFFAVAPANAQLQNLGGMYDNPWADAAPPVKQVKEFLPTTGKQAVPVRMASKVTPPGTYTSMPYNASYKAPGNLALRQVNRTTLPQTKFDSFVRESGYDDRIYGGEAECGPCPYKEFTYDHRINAGIVAARDEGITTGHGSFLPSAWGNDEFLGQEFYTSGPTGKQVATPGRPIDTSPRPYEQPAPGPRDNSGDSESPGEPNPNDPNNIPPGWVGVSNCGGYLGAYNPEVDTFESFLQREHPRAYQDYLSQTGQL